MSDALAFEAVDAGYDTTRVLRAVDLRVAPGERVALLGGNGAGKTTLLRVGAGLLRQAAGRVTVFGADPRHAHSRRRIGVLSHSPPLYPRLSAVENVRFWGRLYGADAGGAAPLLGRLGIDASDHRPAASYSQGMRRRIGLACVLVHVPDLLLLDEPFAGLDRTGAEAVGRELSAGSAAVLLATHDTELASAVCASAVRLHDGRLASDAVRP
jgi:ABC-type multidrug transport system ATPase subunit